MNETPIKAPESACPKCGSQVSEAVAGRMTVSKRDVMANEVDDRTQRHAWFLAEWDARNKIADLHKAARQIIEESGDGS